MPCEAPVMTATFWLYALMVHLLEGLVDEKRPPIRGHAGETIRPVN
jgi:hypothetical protein